MPEETIASEQKMNEETVMEYAIEVKDLVKRYKDFVALFCCGCVRGGDLRYGWTECFVLDDDD